MRIGKQIIVKSMALIGVGPKIALGRLYRQLPLLQIFTKLLIATVDLAAS